MKVAVPFTSLFAPVCLVLCACGSSEDSEREAAFVDSLHATLRDQGGASKFDLNTVTTFDWDIVHIFRPYTKQKAIRNAIGSDIEDRLIHQRDDINLLVFTKNGDVVLTVEVPLGTCDVAPSPIDAGTQHFRVATEQAWFEYVVDDAGYCRMTPIQTTRD